jgi:ESCRT-I complex subunit MVB12
MSRNKIIQRNSINPLESLMNILPCDRPIKSIQLIENYESCPAHFVPLHKTLDTDSDADLLKENILFGKRNTRYLCISKTEGLPNFVLEKIRIIGNNENLANEGFISIKSTADTNQKAWRKKQLVYKLSKTENVTECITDIILMTKNNRQPPEGFTYLGELEKVHICYKLAPIKPEIVDFTNQIANLKIQSTVYPSVSTGKLSFEYR